jgi:hypothetical protein
VETLANGFLEELRSLIDGRLAPRDQEVSSDAFPAARLSTSDFEKLFARIGPGQSAEDPAAAAEGEAVGPSGA